MTEITDSIARLEVLVERIRDWTGLGTLLPFSSVPLSSYKSWLHQAKNDPSLSSTQVDAWLTSLKTQLYQATTRYDFAKLFGDLLDEWLKSSDSLNIRSLPKIRSQLMLKQMLKWLERQRISELIFEAKPTDTAAITAYLENLFSEPHAAAALTVLRDTISAFGDKLRKGTVDNDDMRALINLLVIYFPEHGSSSDTQLTPLRARNYSNMSCPQGRPVRTWIPF
ncbi:hypothetical protein PILCRDRAFT_16128 [Piloderma croceum F 1598]|uniref:Uncharacterized protein n=1 Tax=Piloderma croceum (strain F 1598) TaxID=765440 RepID=A0A0C3EII5_PILCF|nr:hypothetical protein PILCRDRAFT_16128 [Piloderma croceum F 1598]